MMKLPGNNLINLCITFCAALLLTSCGGGGGTTATPAATITSISPKGLVASGTARSLSITGTTFANGMTISVTDGSTIYTTGAVNVTTPELMTTTVTIPSAPTNRYVTVTIKSSAGTALASTILGVASTNQLLQSTTLGTAPATTDIQYIFDNNCISCHGSNGGLDLRSALVGSNITSAINLIDTNSTGCSQKLRVSPGDPRRVNNVLLDVIQAKTTTAVLSCNTSTSSPDRRMPNPAGASGLAQPDIDAIIDWIAGGAR